MSVLLKEDEKPGGAKLDGKPPVVLGLGFVGLTKPEDRRIGAPASALYAG